MHGVVNLDKPVGPTSHDMVGLLRRLTGMRRIGHAGTLDPLASGVLPVLVGVATRLSEELTGGEKRYEALIRLGWRSPTDDAEGPLERGGPLPEERRAVEVLSGFVGRVEQRPPAFSARKQAGRTAHRAARAGSPMELPPRWVSIHAIDLLGVERGDDRLDLRVDIRCGAGTYIRSLARDVGELLGSGGYLASLRRTQAAGLVVADAVTPETLERLAGEGRLEEAIVPLDRLLSLPRVDLDAASAQRFVHGAALRVTPGNGRRAVYSETRLIGVGTLSHGVLHPDKVLVEPVA